MSCTKMTRRSVMAGAAAVPLAGAAAVPALAAPSNPRSLVDTLAEELSVALEDFRQGGWRAEIWPRNSDSFPIRFTLIRAAKEQPDAELVALGNEYDRLAAIEDRLSWRSRQLDLDGPPRFKPGESSYSAERTAWEQESGFNEALEELEKLDPEIDPLAEQIMAMQPVTFAGIAAKAKVARQWLGWECFWDKDNRPVARDDVDDYADRLVRQFVEELIVLGDGTLRSRAEGAS